MKVIYQPGVALEFEYTVVPFSEAAKAAVDAMRHWSKLEDLVSFANDRHGYCNGDGYFGITYPDDLDEWDRANGEFIEEGSVSAFAGYGDPNSEEYIIAEAEYIELLKQYLGIRGRPDLVRLIHSQD